MVERFGRTLAVLALVGVVAACSGSDSGADLDPTTAFATDIRAAAAAVEAELGGPQEYFEITATPQLTNVFVAVDDATVAVPYLYVDGELQPPAPRIEGAAGQTFTADAIDFDEDTILVGVREQLPEASIDSLSVEGGAAGFVRYIVSVHSDQGGVLDVVVAPSGAVAEVQPL